MLLGMRHITVATFVVLLLTSRAVAGVEKWADPALPVKDNIAVWLDATRQTLFRLHRRKDTPWGWLIVGFLGNLPLANDDDIA